MKRYLFLGSVAAVACFDIFNPLRVSAATNPKQPDKPNFNGTWALDQNASNSLEPIMQKIGASLIDQKLAALGQLIIKRYLLDGTKSEGIVFTLKLNGQPDEISVRQI